MRGVVGDFHTKGPAITPPCPPYQGGAELCGPPDKGILSSTSGALRLTLPSPFTLSVLRLRSATLRTNGERMNGGVIIRSP